MSLYAQAVATVNSLSEDHIRALTDADTIARRAYLDGVKSTIRACVSADDKLHPVFALIAEAAFINDQDKYPSIHAPKEVEEVYRAAVRACGYVELPSTRQTVPILRLLSTACNSRSEPTLSFDNICADLRAAASDAYVAMRAAQSKRIVLG